MNHFLRNSVKTALLGLAFTTAFSATQAQTWIGVNTDPSGDGSNANLLDGTGLSYAYDQPSDSVWFKVDVNNLSSNLMNVGVNLMVNIPSGGSTFNFWGNNNTAAFHKLVTVWVTGTPPSSYTGTIGVSDAAGVGSSNYISLSQNNISISVNASAQNIVLGMKRVDLVTDTEMGGQQVTMEVAAAVGSSTAWNDDVYVAGRTMTIDKEAVGLNENRVDATKWSVYPNPTRNVITLEWEAENGLRQQLEVRDVTGRLIQSQDLGDAFSGFQRHQLDLSALASGYYTVRLLSDGQAVATSTVVRQL